MRINWDTVKILKDISEKLNIQLNIVEEPNCSEMIIKGLMTVDDIEFKLNESATFIKTIGSSVIIVSRLGNKVYEKENISNKTVESVLQQCKIMNAVYGKDKGICYYDTTKKIDKETFEESYEYVLKVDTPKYLKDLNEESFKQVLFGHFETLKKLSVSVKGVIYIYTGYEDN